MKQFLIPLFLVLSSTAFAITPKEAWQNANMRDKVRLINEYREFYRQLDHAKSLELSDFKTTSYSQLFISDAYAASVDGLNCVYAGWPSKRVNNLCSSPKKQNPSYSSGSCGASQMQCQPMLFGKDICVPVATQSQRNSAFSNCSKEFEASKRSTEEVVNQIKDNKQEAELFEFMEFARNICSKGKQASTPMCRRLEGALDRMKTSEERLKDSQTDIPQVIIDKKKINEMITTIGKLPPPDPTVEVLCEDPTLAIPPVEGSPYLRDTPRYSETEYIGSNTSDEQFWDNQIIKYKESPDEIPSGFVFTNTGPNSVASGEPLLADEKVERQWSFTTEDGSKQESYIWITDDAGSGKLSELMESIILVVPRKVQPSVELSGEEMIVTLPTGEKVVYDKMTKVIKSGPLKEGKVDLNPNRFNRKFAPITYSGPGISIRVDKRGEDPRLLGVSATISQNGVTCKIPVAELWTSKTKFKYADDAKLLTLLNDKCGNKFKM